MGASCSSDGGAEKDSSKTNKKSRASRKQRGSDEAQEKAADRPPPPSSSSRRKVQWNTAGNTTIDDAESEDELSTMPLATQFLAKATADEERDSRSDILTDQLRARMQLRSWHNFHVALYLQRKTISDAEQRQWAALGGFFKRRIAEIGELPPPSEPARVTSSSSDLMKEDAPNDNADAEDGDQTIDIQNQQRGERRPEGLPLSPIRNERSDSVASNSSVASCSSTRSYTHDAVARATLRAEERNALVASRKSESLADVVVSRESTDRTALLFLEEATRQRLVVAATLQFFNPAQLDKKIRRQRLLMESARHLDATGGPTSPTDMHLQGSSGVGSPGRRPLQKVKLPKQLLTNGVLDDNMRALAITTAYQ